MRLAAAGLSSALAPLGGCAEQVGQQRVATHLPTPGGPLTPTESWYWMSILGSHEADLASYRLKIGGALESGQSLSIAQLRSDFELVREKITLSCVGNSPNGLLLSSSIFQGVRVRDVLTRAGIDERASGALITGLDGFASYQAVEELMRPESLFALDMGPTEEELAPLPIDHGFPCRILTPGLYGYMQPKWIDNIQLLDQGGYTGVVTKSIPYFEGKMQLSSGFSTLRSGVTTEGANEVLGYAFGDGRAIVAVHISVDGGPWQPTEIVYNEIDDGLPSYLWVLWSYTWQAPVGAHVLRCRATYADGETQFDGQSFPYSGGSIAAMNVQVQPA